MSCTIIYDNVWAYPKGREDDIKKALAYRPAGYNWSKAYKRGFWDGWSSVYDVKEKRFPAGLVPYVRDYLAGRDITLALSDTRIKPEPYPWGDSQRVLDSYQAAAVEAAIGTGRGVIHFPTSAGKTTIMGDTIRQVGQPSLVVCNSVSLMTQLARELETVIGKTVGVCGGGVDTHDDITVATVQTLVERKPAWLAKIGLVAVDEAHHLQAPTYAQVMQLLTSAYWRLGFSGTPFRSRNAAGAADRATFLHVVGWTGEVLAVQTKQEAISVGRLVPADIFIVSYEGPWGKRWNGASEAEWKKHYTNLWKAEQPRNYGMDQDDFLIHCEERNRIITHLTQTMMKRRQQVVILVERTAHGQLLSEQIGIPFIFGGTPHAEREQLFQAFRDNKQRALIVSKIGDEGLDLPNIGTLILAGAGKAAHRQIQRIGRGLRTSTGKAHLNVFDFADQGLYLHQHSSRRRRTYEAEPVFTVVDITAADLDEWARKA